MKKVECIIRPSHFNAVKDALASIDVQGMTVTQVMGFGKQKGHTEMYRGSEFQVNLLPKIKIEVIVKDQHVAQLVDVVSKAARTGEVGDGKIFVYDVVDGYRIRTGEQGEAAI